MLLFIYINLFNCLSLTDLLLILNINNINNSDIIIFLLLEYGKNICKNTYIINII